MKLRGSQSSGVSLIEALVAIAIMGFGMLGLAGLQSSLRANADISKQRSEAVRVAQEKLERIRTAASSMAGYDAITSEAAVAVTTNDSNTVYTRTTIVTPFGSNSLASYRQVVVNVSWIDRLNTNPPPSVTLSTLVGGVPPEAQASLGASPAGATVQNPAKRHRAIPRQAKLLEGGISVFKPPQATGSDTVVWVFDNASALLKSCTVAVGSTTASLERTDLGASCLAAAFDQQLLSGFVRFADTAQAASVAQAKLPTGTGLNLDIVLTLATTHPADPTCFDDAPTTDVEAAVPGRPVAYYCAIPRRTDGTWAGRSRIKPVGLLSPPSSAWLIHHLDADKYKVCRYTPMGTPQFEPGDGRTNLDHPLDYSNQAGRSIANGPVTHQNFLVIKASDICPAHTPTADEPINANTLVHQDGSVDFDNPP